MNNEEKIQELIEKYPVNKGYMTEQEKCVYKQGLSCGAYQIAQWKDEQLESKLMQIIILAQQGYTSGATDEMILKHCKEIINENHEHDNTKTDYR